MRADAPSASNRRRLWTVAGVLLGLADGSPSLRYLTLLREGARAHGLPEHWVRYLESVKHAA